MKMMRAAALFASLLGVLSLAVACSSSSPETPGPENTTPDAATTNTPDTAPANLADTAPTNTPDTAPANTPDTTPAYSPDTGADVQASTPEPDADPALNPGSVASSSLARASAELSEAEKRDLAASLSGFAFALFEELRRDPSVGKSFAFSPTSISLALGMAYAGAMGNTAAQMKDAMRVTASSDAYFRSLNWLDQQLGSRADAALKQAQDMFARSGSYGTAPDPASYRLHVVNACWGDRTFKFEQPYLDTLAVDFGSGVRLADFLNRPDAERLAINAWVSEQTLNRINDLIPPGSVDSRTRAILVNAIHLKLPWYDPFLPASTTPGAFTRTDGSTVSVPFMNRGGSMLYAEDDTTQVVSIPLSGRSVSFVVMLPKATSSLTQLEDSLSATRVQTLLASMTSQTVILALPKFTFTTDSVHLGLPLVALGMKDAFSMKDADFTGMAKEKPLFIADVVHKAMVGVDENGVEAAAATAVMMSGGAAPSQQKQMTVNRPFFFGIYDQPTSTWLFLGHVTDPSS
jgi:serpin B